VNLLLQCKTNKYFTFWVCVCVCVCVCVSVALVMQHTMHMRHIVICGPSGSTIIFHIMLYKAQFSKKNVIGHEKCNSIFSTNLVWNIPHCKKNCVRCDHKCPMFFIWRKSYTCKTWINLEFSQNIFEIYQNINLNRNPSSGSSVVSCGLKNG